MTEWTMDMFYDAKERKFYRLDKTTGEWLEQVVVSSSTTTFHVPFLPGRSNRTESEEAVSDYPGLTEMTTEDLVRLLAEYVKTSDEIIEADRAFIKAIQDELRKRKP